VGLCRRWNLDTEIIDSITVHHSSPQRVVPLKFISSTSLPAALLTAAQVSDYMEEVSQNLSCNRENIERLLMQVFALRPNDVFRVLADVDSRVSELSATFGIDVGRSPSLESILAEAQELLGQIALASQLRLVGAPCPTKPERARQASEQNSDRDAQWRDQLTGTFNRVWLESALSSVIDQAHQHSVPIGVLFVGLDHLKQLNEKIGQQAGDALLQETAKILRQCVRLTDSVVRYGADEFVVTLKDVNLDMLTMLADQIRMHVSKAFSSDDAGDPVTCSIGAVFYTPQTGTSVRSEILIREAHRSRDEAHRQGGDRMVLSSLEGGRWVAQATTAGVTV
jgi:diguanylate cyclase (GGDEF)-like protein